MVKLYAHSGISTRYPENSLAAFRAALELGVDGIELDIHCTSDGVPVVIHDESLERTTNGTGPVLEISAADLALLDAGNGERIPPFEEVVQLVGDRLHFDIEIKAPNCEPALLDLLARYPDTKAAISSFDWQVLANVHELSPETELWVLTPTVTDDAIDAAHRLKATTLAVHYLAISTSSMRKATAAQLEVMAWTVNSPHEAKRLRDLGVSALCSDDPAALV